MDKKFHDERRKGVGGSDAPAVLGLSKWATPYQIWQEKRGLSPPREDTPDLEWGKRLEPVIVQKYADVTGCLISRPKDVLTHPQFAYAIAHVDGITDNYRLLEAKKARSDREWGEQGTDEVPPVYLVQVQHCLAVTGLSVADIAVLFGNSDFRIYTVEADAELQNIIMEREGEFWEMVESNTPPEPISFADAVQRYNIAERDKRVVATEEISVKTLMLRELKAHAVDIEDQIKDAQTAIMRFMGEADILQDSKGKSLITWRQARGRTSFDAQALKEAKPKLHAKYMKTGEPGRRFLIK